MPIDCAVGPKLRARSLPAQRGEVAIAVAVLNRMIRTAKPVLIRIAKAARGRVSSALCRSMQQRRQDCQGRIQGCPPGVRRGSARQPSIASSALPVPSKAITSRQAHLPLSDAKSSPSARAISAMVRVINKVEAGISTTRLGRPKKPPVAPNVGQQQVSALISITLRRNVRVPPSSTPALVYTQIGAMFLPGLLLWVRTVTPALEASALDNLPRHAGHHIHAHDLLAFQ